jgi:hypothetical protein
MNPPQVKWLGSRVLSEAQLNFAWGSLGLIAWTFRCFHEGPGGGGFPAAGWAKGLPLLLGSLAVYRSVGGRDSLLPMFPLVWLGLSKFQWDLCASPGFLWLWPALFLAVFWATLKAKDGRKLLPGLAPLWAVQAWLLPQSFVFPFAFLTAGKGRFKNSGWIRWGGAAAGILIFLWSRGWRYFHLDWVDLYDLLVTGRYISFFLLAWLGLASLSGKGTARFAAAPALLLTAGFLFFTPLSLQVPPQLSALRWVWVFQAGLGLECFRRDLADPAWHGQAVWFALGLGFCWGVV